ncbi:hypothetical protein D1872_265070 [compost metagenome]
MAGRIVEFDGSGSTAALAAVLLYFDHTDYAVVPQAGDVGAQAVPCPAARLAASDLADRARRPARRIGGFAGFGVYRDDADRRRAAVHLGCRDFAAPAACTLSLPGLLGRIARCGSVRAQFIPGVYGKRPGGGLRQRGSGIEYPGTALSGRPAALGRRHAGPLAGGLFCRPAVF